MLNFSANISLLFNETELIDRFKAAKQHGFKAVEIQFPYSLSVEAIQKTLEDNGLRLVLFNVAADDLLSGGEGLAAVPRKQDQFRQAVAQALAYAEILKPEAVNILPGCCHDKNRQPDYLETFKENLGFAVEAFAPLGIKTVFEAVNTRDMPEFIIHSGEQMLDILDQLDSPNLFMQYDIYHMYRMGEQPEEFINRHAEKIGHIQFADCPGRGQPGTGQINFRQLFSAIEKSSYSGWTGAEYKPAGLTSESLGWFGANTKPADNFARQI
ncbi:hydroxypyruvate isomerase [Candidatus Methylobacter favarea]|uniref:Hydroxypyruvate isomerase n=1 Tax=Candidatus Methylobacter favarea TaxID=2707345 RepID=A0A8S0YAI2_9GAMM|nr:TIM barrel protein [Candidatus Methylobacter favarea]CAA9891947.1 hydroxypyruvate isomerase [Candidatus Methylobacter favarea]